VFCAFTPESSSRGSAGIINAALGSPFRAGKNQVPPSFGNVFFRFAKAINNENKPSKTLGFRGFWLFSRYRISRKQLLIGGGQKPAKGA
jgi:hypothetical protein